MDCSDEVGKENYSRPVGRKRAEEQLGKNYLSSKRLKIAEETLEAQNERNELLLFTTKIDNSDPVVAEYMAMKRRNALKRLKASETSSISPETPLSPTSSQTQ